MATTTEQDRVRELQRALYRAAKADPHGGSRMPAVKNVGEPCAGEPHARFEVAAGGNLASRHCRAALAPPADPTSRSRRRVELLASTSAPDGAWVTQQARNLLMALDGRQQPFRLLIHDRDRKFSRSFDEVFRSEAIEVIKTPVQAPNANAYAERWVRTLRSDCLDRCLILSGRHLDHLLRVYREHYNGHRPHRSLALHPPHASRPLAPARASPNVAVCRRDLLGGLL